MDPPNVVSPDSNNMIGSCVRLVHRRRLPARIMCALIPLLIGINSCSLFKAPAPINIEIPKPPAPPPPPPPPLPATRIHATVIAATDVNPDRHGRPSPIVVKVYELKSLAAFDAADFFSLFERDAATLGSGMNARDDFVLLPGSAQTLERSVDASTRFLAIVAGYRDLEGTLWRGSTPVHPHQSNRVTFRLDATRVSASFQSIAQDATAPAAN